MKTMVKTDGLVTAVRDFIREKVVWLLTSNVIYRLWKKGDELDLRYETLYQEVRARRVKLLILALCVIACTAQCVLKATMSRYIAARGNSLALCRLPWVPLSMIAEVKSWNLGNNKTSIAGECTSNNTAQYTASLEEFHWQLLWKIVSNKVSCNTKPCTELEYRVIRATDSCQTGSFQGSQQHQGPERAEEKLFVVSVNAVEEEITAVFTYGLEDALNDIGGIVGLFFGTSMLTLYEVFERRLFQEESFDVTGKRFRAHRSRRARRSNSTEQGLLDATLLSMRLSFGGATYERRINQLWGLYFIICFCICVWQCCLESFLNGYIRQWYRTAPQTALLRSRETWTQMGPNSRLTSNVGPCYFDWITADLSHLPNINLYPCSSLANVSLHVSHVAAVLSQQFFNDGALGDLGTKHCNCLPPCDTVESYSTEQYGLLTVRRRQQQTTAASADDDPNGPIYKKSSFLTMHVSSAIDEFSDVELDDI